MSHKITPSPVGRDGVGLRIAVLGATGSIGRQTLDIVDRYPEKYSVSVLSAGTRVDELAELALRHRPRLVVIGKEELLPRLRSLLEGSGIECAAGDKALEACVDADDIDTVVTATVGYSGLAPTIRAIRAGKDIALANKETLVVAGDLVNRLLDESTSKIFPVDSEHSAVAQCLMGEDIDSVERLVITASGGPFRTWDAGRIFQATAADALQHPNWNMGRKITVDSASMLNKAFEIIEAHHLFRLPAKRIDAVVHPQSIIHSMVEFKDGAMKAQLGVPDMRLPIAFAMGQNVRLADVSPRLSLADYGTLTFEAPDMERFPCLALAQYSLEKGGNTACVVNAANEIAVEAFLNGLIPFGHIYTTIRRTLDTATFVATPSYEDYVASNDEARALAAEIVKTLA